MLLGSVALGVQSFFQIWHGDSYLHRYEDQQKVRRAIAAQRVDPEDIPATAKVAVPLATPPLIVSGPYVAGPKRRYQSDVAETSRSLSQSSIPNANAARGPLGDDDDEVMLIEPEPVDEFHCVMNTSIVGIQYYKGMDLGVLSQVILCISYM